MELGREERFPFVAYAFVGAVVHVYEQGLPLGGQSVVVDCEAVVLRCHKAAIGAHLAHRLVMAAVAVFELVGVGAGGFCQQLVAHADAAYRFFALESAPRVHRA